MFRHLLSNISAGMFVMFLLIGLLSVTPQPVSATRFGFSATGGAGLFIAEEPGYYGDIAVDLYPEIGFHIDASIMRFGLVTGLIYRKFEYSMEYFDYDYDYDYDEYYYWEDEYTMAYLPVQAEILVAPLSGGKDQSVSPYIGIMVGVFVPVGDNDDALPAVSIKAGVEFCLDPIIFYGDLRYTYAPHDFEGYGGADVNAGGVMFVVGGGLRFGTTE